MRDLIPPNEYRTNVMEQWQSRRCNSYDSFAIEMHLIKVIKIEWIRIYEENKCFFLQLHKQLRWQLYTEEEAKISEMLQMYGLHIDARKRWEWTRDSNPST